MESIVVLILFLVLSSIGSKNKKKKKQTMRTPAAPQRMPERGAVPSAAMPRDAFAPAGERAAGAAVPKDAFAPKAKKEPAPPAPKQTLIEQEKGRCESRPLHLHEVTQAQMQAAGEGEDPCHRGGIVLEATPVPRAAGMMDAEKDSPVYASPFDADEDARREQLRRDLVRGVVMSEILTTPRQRRALRRAAAEGGRI